MKYIYLYINIAVQLLIVQLSFLNHLLEHCKDFHRFGKSEILIQF